MSACASHQAWSAHAWHKHLIRPDTMSSVTSRICLITAAAAAAAAAAVYLEGLIGLATVGGTCMVDDFTLQGPRHRVPEV